MQQVECLKNEIKTNLIVSGSELLSWSGNVVITSVSYLVKTLNERRSMSQTVIFIEKQSKQIIIDLVELLPTSLPNMLILVFLALVGLAVNEDRVDLHLAEYLKQRCIL